MKQAQDPASLGHTVVLTQKLEESYLFWHQALGFRQVVLDVAHGYAELEDAQGRRFALVTAEGLAPFVQRPVVAPPTQTHKTWQQPLFFSVDVENIDATLAQVLKAGGQLLCAPKRMPWGKRVAFVRDVSSGLGFELSERRQ